MTQSRLIVLEGVAGSGKSTLARYVGDLLEALGAVHHVIVEGDLDNPADHESVAWLPKPAYADLLDRHPLDARLIQGRAEPHDGGFLVTYGVLRNAGLASASTLDDLSGHDIYELPEPTFRRLALQRWQAFGKRAAAKPDVWVLDCCLLQNPVTTLLVKHNCDERVIRDHIQAVTEAVSALKPVVVHLHQGDIRATLDRVIAERPTAWRDFFVSYHTEQDYGRAHQLQGIEGTVRALTARQRLEEELLGLLPVTAVHIDISGGWDEAKLILCELIG